MWRITQSYDNGSELSLLKCREDSQIVEWIKNNVEPRDEQEREFPLDENDLRDLVKSLDILQYPLSSSIIEGIISHWDQSAYYEFKKVKIT